MSADPLERSQQSREKQRRILDAAVKVFAEKGYHGSRVSDIAREAVASKTPSGASPKPFRLQKTSRSWRASE